jgi:hypothetical protein
VRNLSCGEGAVTERHATEDSPQTLEAAEVASRKSAGSRGIAVCTG